MASEGVGVGIRGWRVSQIREDSRIIANEQDYVSERRGGEGIRDYCPLFPDRNNIICSSIPSSRLQRVPLIVTYTSNSTPGLRLRA